MEQKKQEFIESIKNLIQEQTGQDDIKVEIPDEILQQIMESEEDKSHLEYEGETEAEQRYNKSVDKSCLEKPIISREEIIQNGDYKITVRVHQSNYNNSRTDNAFLYYYFKLEDLKDSNNNLENWEVVSDNEVTRSILEFLGKSDEELNIKYTTSYEYRKKLCESIDMYWD